MAAQGGKVNVAATQSGHQKPHGHRASNARGKTRRQRRKGGRETQRTRKREDTGGRGHTTTGRGALDQSPQSHRLVCRGRMRGQRLQQAGFPPGPKTWAPEAASRAREGATPAIASPLPRMMTAAHARTLYATAQTARCALAETVGGRDGRKAPVAPGGGAGPAPRGAASAHCRGGRPPPRKAVRTSCVARPLAVRYGRTVEGANNPGRGGHLREGTPRTTADPASAASGM